MKHATLLSILTVTSLALFTSCEKHSSTELANETAGEEQQILDYTDQEKELLNDVEKMFKKKDVSILMKRTYEDKDYEEGARKVEEEYLQGIIDAGMGKLELERISPPETHNQGFDGETRTWSLPLKWRLIIHEPKNEEGINVSYLIHFSEHEDRLVIIRELVTAQ